MPDIVPVPHLRPYMAEPGVVGFANPRPWRHQMNYMPLAAPAPTTTVIHHHHGNHYHYG